MARSGSVAIKVCTYRNEYCVQVANHSAAQQSIRRGFSLPSRLADSVAHSGFDTMGSASNKQSLLKQPRML